MNRDHFIFDALGFSEDLGDLYFEELTDAEKIEYFADDLYYAMSYLYTHGKESEQFRRGISSLKLSTILSHYEDVLEPNMMTLEWIESHISFDLRGFLLYLFKLIKSSLKINFLL